MKYRKSKTLLWIMLSCVLLLSGCGAQTAAAVSAKTAEEEAGQETAEGQLTVTYLDVGQGNAIVAESEGHTMLIDGGDRESSSFVVSSLKKRGIQKLDYILISHFDEDHLAGAIGAIHSIGAETVLTPDYTADSAIYRSYEEAMREREYQAVHPKPGQEFSLGSASFRVISPVSYGHQDENQDSVGIILENGKNRFFIGGDIGLEGELEILEQETEIQADVLLMNHHGSHVSQKFFQAIDPSYAVISCGKGNSYGHPREDTVKLLESFQVPLFRTDIQGSITADSDGSQINFDQEPCNQYTPGERGTSQEETVSENVSNSSPESCDYILNLHTKKIHRPDCSSIDSMGEKNKGYYKGEKQALLEQGYTPCGNCRP